MGCEHCTHGSAVGTGDIDALPSGVQRDAISPHKLSRTQCESSDGRIATLSAYCVTGVVLGVAGSRLSCSIERMRRITAATQEAPRIEFVRQQWPGGLLHA